LVQRNTGLTMMKGTETLVHAAGDLLVAMLNIDAEIRDRMERLAELERSTDDLAAPWLDEARTALRTDVVLLTARREECFLRLNGARVNQPPRSTSTQGMDCRASSAGDARTCDCL
jgi:hypothetical protein